MRNIYMNEFIREKKTHVPVIVVEDPSRGGKTVYAQEVTIYGSDGELVAIVRYDPDGHGPSKTHDVKVWVEVQDNASVEVL